MNARKICVSLGEASLPRLRERIKAIAGKFELIEVRADYVDLSESKPASDDLGLASIFRSFPDQKFVVTLRTTEQGGINSPSTAMRRSFWDSDFGAEFADLEGDVAGQKSKKQGWKHRILSAHNFESPELPEVQLLTSEAKPGDVIKLAVTIADVTEGLEVWKLLEDTPAKWSDNGIRFIPVAMGESGKWTRILAPAFGAPFTYASPDDESLTAAGQLCGEDLANVFRVGELDRETEIYGIVGSPVSNSVSPYMHNAGFLHYGLNAVYIPLEVEDLETFIKRMVREESREIGWNLKGFSVTAPHKRRIIEYLDFLDPEAAAIGSVNTVQLMDGKLVGFNTDASGFLAPLVAAYGDISDVPVALIGGGGAARACVYALSKAGAKVTVFARDPVQLDQLSSDFGCLVSRLERLSESISRYRIAVNATPLGSRGDLENETPLAGSEIKSLQLVYDLVYNPRKPLFLREAEKAGLPIIEGCEMLIAQGIQQFEQWTGKAAPVEKMRKGALSRLR